jgi:hypothetical protein
MSALIRAISVLSPCSDPPYIDIVLLLAPVPKLAARQIPAPTWPLPSTVFLFYFLYAYSRIKHGDITPLAETVPGPRQWFYIP